MFCGQFFKNWKIGKSCKTGQLFCRKGAARSKLNLARNTARSDPLNHKFGTFLWGEIWHFLGPKNCIWSSMVNIGWWNFQPGRFSRCWARWVMLERRRRWKNTFLRPISNFGRISCWCFSSVRANLSSKKHLLEPFSVSFEVWGWIRQQIGQTLMNKTIGMNQTLVWWLANVLMLMLRRWFV